MKISFPDWIYDFREQILRKIGRRFRQMCQIVKDEGFAFKVKYPVEAGGRWKFADAYIPDCRTAVVLTSERDYIGLPCHSKPDKVLFFSDRCRVVELSPYDDLQKFRERLSSINFKITHDYERLQLSSNIRGVFGLHQAQGV